MFLICRFHTLYFLPNLDSHWLLLSSFYVLLWQPKKFPCFKLSLQQPVRCNPDHRRSSLRNKRTTACLFLASTSHLRILLQTTNFGWLNERWRRKKGKSLLVACERPVRIKAGMVAFLAAVVGCMWVIGTEWESVGRQEVALPSQSQTVGETVALVASVELCRILLLSASLALIHV